MLEAATAGAKVLHNRAVNLAKKYKLKLSVKNTENNNRGTLVTNEEDTVSEKSNTKILAVKKELAKITVVGSSMYSNIDYIAKVYLIAKENKVQIYMLSLTEMSLSIIVDEKNADNFSKILHGEFIEKKKLKKRLQIKNI